MEITTNTIAELYIKQGYPEKAIDIYKAILELDPGNVAAAERIQKLEAEMRGEAAQLEETAAPVAAPAVEPALQVETPAAPAAEPAAQPVMEPAAANSGSSVADQVARLESWLANIQTVRGAA